MLKKIPFLIILFFFFHWLNLYAQGKKERKTHTLTTDEAKMVNKDAAGSFNSGDYNAAIKGYTDLIKTSPSNPDYNYRLGVCILNTNSNKASAVPYLETASKTNDKKKDKDVWYYLGMAYMNANLWDEAIMAFNTFKSAPGFKVNKEQTSPERLIEMCNNGKELTSHPVDVKFENMGKGINSVGDDYNPCISADGKMLVYTTRRKGNIGGFIPDLGIFTSDIFYAQYRGDTAWTKGKGVGVAVNTDFDEETVGLSADGNVMFVYFDNNEAFGDIGVATLKGRNWQKPVMLGTAINSKSVESGACISNDGQVLYFASDRGGKESQGGSDIWFCIKQSGGEWGNPQNIGAEINTKYDETNPFISVDGRSLYFASKGHNSMGGYDVFVSTFDSAVKKWSAPKNLGYPINTADDEDAFTMTGDGRHAYMGAIREGGMGERDIYRITFNDTSSHPFMSLISGTIGSGSPTKVELRQVTLINKADNKTVSVYRPYFMSNSYVVAALAGSYMLKVEGYGFQPVEEEITVSDKLADITKNFTVQVSK